MHLLEGKRQNEEAEEQGEEIWLKVFIGHTVETLCHALN